MADKSTIRRVRSGPSANGVSFGAGLFKGVGIIVNAPVAADRFSNRLQFGWKHRTYSALVAKAHSMIVRALQRMVVGAHARSCQRSDDWSGQRVARLRPESLLDVGCGDGSFLFRYIDHKPKLFCGIEAAPELMKRAEAKGIQVQAFDLNGVWPYADNTFDAVHCSQVIEHLHNTRLFTHEILRVLKPGGSAFITSENLTSFLNTTAMLFGYTPFTLMRCCGWFLGNPLGLHSGEHVPEGVPMTDPAFAGVTGHVRALSVLQAQELFELVGFSDVKATSIGLMPLPDWFGRPLERLMYRRGHLLLIEAKKPEK